MGDVEDTFTKQEIQAGYVTSGRDVLARQQQIVQQALSAASGAAGSTPRRKIGGGGPSSTGRASANPVFPPPSYDEPSRPTASVLVPPPPGTLTRAATIGAGFPTIAAANAAAASAAVPIPSKSGIVRASSAGSVTPASSAFTGPTPKGSIGSAVEVVRKGVIGASGLTPNVGPGTRPLGATAASVVAGVHSVSGSNEPPAPHTTLTPLTPLKRSSVTKGGTKVSAGDGASELKTLNNSNLATTKLTSLRAGGKKNGVKAPGSPSSDASPGKNQPPGRADGVSSIGGAVIATPVAVAPPVIGGSVGPNNGVNSSRPSAMSGIGGEPLSGLGGDVFNMPRMSQSAIGNGAPIGSNKDKWNSTAIGGDPVLAGGFWANGSGNPGHGPNMGQGGGGVIGGGTIGGGFGGSGSSALASMLGINLPTGSGSLRETPNLWGAQQAPGGPPPIAALNGSSVPMQGVGGYGSTNSNNGLIGGVTIGGGQAPMGPGAIGSGGNPSDIALLQSLLPGVHITSGGSYNQGSGFGAIGGGGGDWNSAPGANQSQQPAGSANLRMGAPQQPQQWNGGLQSSLGGQPVGAIGQGATKQGQRQAPGSIW
jgi:hypothetical protein